MLSVLLLLLTAMTKKLFEVDFSAKGSPWRDREEVTYIFFADFLGECEGVNFTYSHRRGGASVNCLI